MGVVYLDNNATTRVAPEVMEEMAPYFGGLYGNPSSAHVFGSQVGGDVGLARERAADALECEPGEIVFTSCGTESDNTAILSAVRSRPDKSRLVVSAVEHPAVLNLAARLEAEGMEVVRLGVDSLGRLDMAEVEASLAPNTAVVSVMQANNETGVLFPVAEIAGMCRDRGIPFHTDSVQAVGKVPVSMRIIGCDYAAVSGHKLHGPKGAGLLFVRKGAPFVPLLVGGGQESGRRAGTENTAGIIGLGKALELAVSGLEGERARVKALRGRLERGLVEAVLDAAVIGDPENRLPNTLFIAFKGAPGGEVVEALDRAGICAGSGSACHSGCAEPSHVAKAMGLPPELALCAVRLTLSRFTTNKEIDAALEVLPGIVAEARS